MINIKHYFTSRYFQETLLVVVVFGLMVGYIFGPINPLISYPSRDSSLFLYAGQQLLKGGDLYIDVWENKGPAIFFINAFGLWAANGSRWGVWFFEYFLILSAVIFGYAGLRSKWGHPAALFASVTWVAALGQIHGGGNFTESYSLFFAFLVLAIFLIKSAPYSTWFFLIVGVSLAGSFHLRANNIGLYVSLLFSIAAVGFLKREFQQVFVGLFWTFLGFLLPTLILIGYFFYRGNLFSMIEASLVYNFYYSDITNSFNFSVWSGIQQIGIPAYLAVLAYILGVARGWKKVSAGEYSALHLFLIFGWPIEALLSSISSHEYSHYFICWLPVLSVLLGFLFTEFANFAFSDRFLKTLNRPGFLFGWMFLGMVLIYLNTGMVATYRDVFVRLIFQRENGIEAIDPVSRYVRRSTQDHDHILVWGVYHRFYYLSRRTAPTPFVSYPVYVVSPYLDRMSEQFFKDVTRNKPVLILDVSSSKTDDYVLSINPMVRAKQLAENKSTLYLDIPYQEQFFGFVEQYYEYVETIDGVDIYALVD